MLTLEDFSLALPDCSPQQAQASSATGHEPRDSINDSRFISRRLFGEHVRADSQAPWIRVYSKFIR